MVDWLLIVATISRSTPFTVNKTKKKIKKQNGCLISDFHLLMRKVSSKG